MFYYIFSKKKEVVMNNEKDEIILRDDERQVCEVWTRVMGYYRPVSMFNEGKKTEFAARVYYEEKKFRF